MYRTKRFKDSLVYKITISLTFIVAILLTVLILSNIYSLNVVTANMVNASQSQIAIYMNSIRSNLNGASKDLNEISAKYLDSITDYRNKSEPDRVFSAVQIRDALSAKVLNNNTEDGLFVMMPDEELFLVQFSNRIVSNEKMELEYFINTRSFFQSGMVSERWKIIKIGRGNYIVKCFKAYDFLIGVIIKADPLLSFIKSDPFKDAQYALTDGYGGVISLSDASSFLSEVEAIPNEQDIVKNYRSKYFIISEEFPDIGGKFSSIIESKSVFFGLELIQWAIIVMGILSVFIVPIIILYLFREIIKPVQALVVATKEVEKGNWDYNIPRNKAPTEFTKLNESFSSMVKEIKALKIDTYEEKIQRQKAELKYLQMQIRPHFFLNAITTISSLTYQNRNEEIRKLIDFLSKHLRYIFRGGLSKVPLSEEVEHVRNYIRMQEIKFPGNIFHMIELGPGTEECRLPQFLVQTFVENSFKHALTIGKMLSIFIMTEECLIEGETFVHIVIEDNGEGFPDDVIEAINHSGGNENESGLRIGIENIKMTLNLLYKRESLLKVSNCEPSGARVEIFVPFDRGEK